MLDNRVAYGSGVNANVLCECSRAQKESKSAALERAHAERLTAVLSVLITDRCCRVHRHGPGERGGAGLHRGGRRRQ